MDCMGTLAQGHSMNLKIPYRKNERLRLLLDRINQDRELLQWLKSANINAMDRCGMSDHGEIHVRIVANAALRILRLLARRGVAPAMVEHHGMEEADAEVVILLAACLHDVGIAVHRHDHERYSLWLGYPKARALLEGIYDEPGLTAAVCEAMHAVVAHSAHETCLTIEAGVIKVADALDMSEGRSRIPFESGNVNIHSVSAKAVESVDIEAGETRPVRISITLANSAGIFQVDELLQKKLLTSSIKDYVEVVAKIEGETERRIVEMYRL